MYINKYYSARKKNRLLSFAATWTWTDLQIIILSEASQRKTNVTHHLHVKSKNNKNEFSYKAETELQILKETYGYQRGNEIGERDKSGAWDWRTQTNIYIR